MKLLIRAQHKTHGDRQHKQFYQFVWDRRLADVRSYHNSHHTRSLPSSFLSYLTLHSWWGQLTYKREKWELINCNFTIDAIGGIKLRCWSKIVMHFEELEMGGSRKIKEFFINWYCMNFIPKFCKIVAFKAFRLMDIICIINYLHDFDRDLRTTMRKKIVQMNEMLREIFQIFAT